MEVGNISGWNKLRKIHWLVLCFPLIVLLPILQFLLILLNSISSYFCTNDGILNRCRISHLLVLLSEVLILYVIFSSTFLLIPSTIQRVLREIELLVQEVKFDSNFMVSALYGIVQELYLYDWEWNQLQGWLSLAKGQKSSRCQCIWGKRRQCRERKKRIALALNYNCQ